MRTKLLVFLVFAVFMCISSAFSAEKESLTQKVKDRFKPEDKTAVQAASKMQAVAKTTPEIAAPVVEPPKSLDKITDEDIIGRLVKAVDRREEILNFVPGLVKERGGDGKIFYSYNGVKIDELDRASLEKLYVRVRQEAVRINTERLNKQVETINRAGALSGVGRQTSQIPRAPVVTSTPPRLPTVPTAQSLPQTPKGPPATPPAPPRR